MSFTTGRSRTLVIEGNKRHCHVPVFLVASDERIAQYRHPLPCSGKAVERYVMVVGCFQREGLVVSLTRMKKVERGRGIRARLRSMRAST
jgi:hypothetical protein